jgi:peptidoglycan/LPS O-acetylase OafA/YrhL
VDFCIFPGGFITNETKYRRDIQVLRGLAVLAVLLFHAKENYFPLGYLGVDVFFVISGFVVTPLILRIYVGQTVEERLTNLRHFLVSRFYRLAPAFISTIGISAILIFILGPINEHQRFAKQGIASLLLVGNVGAYRYSGDYFSPNPNPLVHTWSLAVEEQIYLFLPLILLLALHKRTRIKSITALIFGCITVISFISFQFPMGLAPFYSAVGLELPSLVSFYSPVDRVWQFTLGGLARLYLDRHRHQRLGISRKSNLLVSLVAIAILFSSLHLSLKVGSIFATLIAIIVLLSKSLDVLPLIVRRIMAWIGDRSYSIYLVHMPLLYIAKYSPITQIGMNENRDIQSALGVVTSILLGALSYSKIESSYRSRAKKNQISIRRLTLIVVLTFLIPFMLLLAIDRSNATLRDPNLPLPSTPLPWEWDPNCRIMGTDIFNLKKPCRYGPTNSKGSILLIGDSHAASNSQAIIELGQRNNLSVNVMTKASCSFIINNLKPGKEFFLPGLDSKCLSHNNEIVKYVNGQRPDIIVLSMRSTSKYIIPNTAASRVIYRESILKSVSILSHAKTSVILVGAEPEYISVEILIQRIVKGMSGKYSDIPTEDNHWWSRAPLERFHHLDTVKIFCPQNLCTNKRGSIWLFNDDHHLSKAGAEMLIPELDVIVKNILIKGGKR